MASASMESTTLRAPNRATERALEDTTLAIVLMNLSSSFNLVLCLSFIAHAASVDGHAHFVIVGRTRPIAPVAGRPSTRVIVANDI